MEHSFNIAVACEYGVLEAIIIRNFQYWIAKNKANKSHYVNEHYWTYNSYDALVELFPYATKDQLKKRILRLVEKGVLLIGHFSENPNDRTNWFAFADEGKWIVQNGTMDGAEMPNGECESARCIYTNNKHTNNKPYIEKEILKEKVSFCHPTIEDVKDYVLSIRSQINVEDFYNYYEATEWKVQGKPMKNWKLVVQTWTKKDRTERPWLYGQYDDKNTQQGELWQS